MELDAVYGALDELSEALGPNGANEDGALSDLVDVGAANLEGNGEALNRTLTGFSQAVQTLAENRDDLFGSLDNLQTFTTRAGHHRRPGRPVQRQHGRGQRAAGRRARGPPGARSRCSPTPWATWRGFVQDNTTLLTTNVDRLADVTLVLVQQRAKLAEVLDVAPAALGNLARAYNPDFGTLDTRDNGLGSLNAEIVVCGALAQAGRVDLTLDLPGCRCPTRRRRCGPPPSRSAPGCCPATPNANGSPDDLNGNGIPDYEELRQALLGGGGGGGGGGSALPGLPAVVAP